MKLTELEVMMSDAKPLSGNMGLDEKIEEWLSWDRNEATRAEVEKLVEDACYKELAKILLERITFGTAGLRGKMAAGFTCMNDLVVIQAGQGLLKHLEEYDRELLSKNGIVIGYDGRYNSQRYIKYIH